MDKINVLMCHLCPDSLWLPAVISGPARLRAHLQITRPGESPEMVLAMITWCWVHWTPPPPCVERVRAVQVAGSHTGSGHRCHIKNPYQKRTKLYRLSLQMRVLKLPHEHVIFIRCSGSLWLATLHDMTLLKIMLIVQLRPAFVLLLLDCPCYSVLLFRRPIGTRPRARSAPIGPT